MSAAERQHTDGHRGPGTDVPGGDTTREASVSDLIGRLGNDVTVLFRQEVELAKLEIKQDLATLGRAGGMLVAAAVLGLVTLLLLAWALAWGLDELLPTWVAFVITAALFGAAAAAIGVAGKKKLDDVDLAPRSTIETLQQDKQMISDRMTS